MKLRMLIALLVGGVLSALFGISSSAMAAQAAAPHAYPQGLCSTLSVSTTTPAYGESFTVTGEHFEPNAKVKIVLQKSGSTIELKTVTSNSDGAFSTSITAPSSTSDGGRYALVAISGYTTGGSCPADPGTSLTLGAAAQHGNGGSGSGGNGGTAFTGLDIAALVALALVLVLGGSFLAYRGRRRTSV